MRILLTGAAGFAGSHILDYLLNYTSHEMVCLISLEHRGNSARLRRVLRRNPYLSAGRLKLIRHDLRAPIDDVTAEDIGDIDVIMNVASESHVDRSILSPRPFIINNVELMTTMLDYARRPEVAQRLLVFLQMSTDEVYGPHVLDPLASTQSAGHPEWSPILPSNPYSASKAAQEAIAVAYWRTYGVPVVITNTMNLFGPCQDREKFPALVMRDLRAGEPVPVHVDRSGVAGSRFYLPVHNLAYAWASLVDRYRTVMPDMYHLGDARPSRYNIVGSQEIDNATFVHMMAKAMGIEKYEIKPVDFHSSRPGHDLRYALDGTALKELGIEFPWSFEDGLRDLVAWSKMPEAEHWL